MEEIHTNITSVHGLRVQYYSAGTGGTPVVMLHGGGTDSALLSWRMAIPALAENHRFYAPDWPGYGGSESLREPFTYERMLDWLAALMDHWDLARASLVGISMGGGGALGYALEHPERVDRLVLVDSYGLQRKVRYHLLSYWMVQADWMMNASWSLIQRSRSMTRWSLSSIFANRRNISEDLVDEVFAAVQDPSAQRTFNQFQKSEVLKDGLRTCLMDRLGDIRAPALVIHGEHDTLVPLADSREAARRISNAQFEIIPGAGHWPMREKPDQFNRLVANFLTE
jgi:pimeloyl-ACP methyl ester carboxylesterase